MKNTNLESPISQKNILALNSRTSSPSASMV